MGTDSLRFPSGQALSSPQAKPQISEPVAISSVQEPSTSLSRRSRILPRSKSIDNDETFSMCSVEAAAFDLIAKRARKNQIYLFAKSIEKIDAKLALKEILKIKILELFTVDAAAVN